MQIIDEIDALVQRRDFSQISTLLQPLPVREIVNIVGTTTGPFVGF